MILTHIRTAVLTSVILASSFQSFFPSTTLDYEIANTNYPVAIHYNKYSESNQPYTEVTTCTIEKTDKEGTYNIISTQPGEVTIYRKLWFFKTKKVITFETPQIKPERNTININSSLKFDIDGISTEAQLSSDTFEIEKVDMNKYVLTPTTDGKCFVSSVINNQTIKTEIMVDNPKMTIGASEAKESTKIDITGVSSDYELSTSDEKLAVIENNNLKCLEPGKVQVILTANGQDFTCDVNIAEHVHKWSEWEHIKGNCTEDSYDISECPCGESKLANVITAKGHQFEHIKVSPTCTERGFEEDVCSVCGTTDNHRNLQKISHTPSDYEIVDKPLSPEIDGSKKGTCSVCGAELEPEKYTYQEMVQNQRRGMGRLCIPDIEIDVALFNSEEQNIPEEQDSAAYYLWNGCYIINDHYDQGFDKIQKCTLGMKCYIVTPTEIQIFECKEIGSEQSNNIKESEWAISATAKYQEQILMYTYNNTSQEIAYARLERIK